ncbi:SDR family oxidoreductase [Streptomyces sp. NPDC002928]|uniref:SDR family NAD(P)-dependent oxidoreductase n=1 Tax=Streptomyces sp. NPDC002928 TaxID=3154440 RepID=UPI0033B66859
MPEPDPTPRSAGTAVVSGTSSGIGAAVAARFLERGHHVVGLSRRGNPRLAAHPSYLDCRADLTDEDSVREALVTASEVTSDGVSAVVLNAGASPGPRELADVPWSVPAEAYEANVHTALNLVQATLPLLQRNGSGTLTFVGASLANGLTPERWAYAASKAAMTTLMRACSVSLAEDRIVANEVRPGPVATPMTMGGAPDAEIREEVLDVINEGYRTDWLKSARQVAEWIVSIAEFPPNGPTGQIFNYSRKPL